MYAPEKYWRPRVGGPTFEAHPEVRWAGLISPLVFALAAFRACSPPNKTRSATDASRCFLQVSVEVMDVLMKYGTAGVAGLVLRREFVEAVEVLKRLSGVDK